MKNKILVSMAFLAASLAAHAGTPEQDYTIDMAREAYRQAKPVTDAALSAHATWRCAELNAVRNVVPKYETQNLFVVFQAQADGTYVNAATSIPFQRFARTGTELVSAISLRSPQGAQTHVLGLRISDSGYLVGEHAFPGIDGFFMYPSVRDKSQKALSYLYCQPL